MTLLHLDSSILGQYSVSRILSSEIVAQQLALHPGVEVVYRDLSADPVLHLSGVHMAARQGAGVDDASVGSDLATGEAYIDELNAAEIIVVGAPMYNFSVPTQLKAWIDRVLVAGKTFRYTETGSVESLLTPGKKIFIASSRGGFYGPGMPTEALDHQESYLRGVFAFIGITDVTIIRAEGLGLGPDAKDAAIGKARAQIAALAA